MIVSRKRIQHFILIIERKQCFLFLFLVEYIYENDNLILLDLERIFFLNVAGSLFAIVAVVLMFFYDLDAKKLSHMIEETHKRDNA